jgi:hypothetical protein
MRALAVQFYCFETKIVPKAKDAQSGNWAVHLEAGNCHGQIGNTEKLVQLPRTRQNALEREDDGRQDLKSRLKLQSASV